MYIFTFSSLEILVSDVKWMPYSEDLFFSCASFKASILSSSSLLGKHKRFNEYCRVMNVIHIIQPTN